MHLSLKMATLRVKEAYCRQFSSLVAVRNACVRLLIKNGSSTHNIAANSVDFCGVAHFNALVSINDNDKDLYFEVVVVHPLGTTESFGSKRCKIAELVKPTHTVVALYMDSTFSSTSLTVRAIVSSRSTPSKITPKRRESRTETPNTNLKTKSRSESPKTRKTSMRVGYVGSAWPEERQAKHEQLLYRLRMTEEKRKELWRDLAIKTSKEIKVRKKKAQDAFSKRMAEHAEERKLRQIIEKKEAQVRDLQQTLMDYAYGQKKRMLLTASPSPSKFVKQPSSSSSSPLSQSMTRRPAVASSSERNVSVGVRRNKTRCSDRAMLTRRKKNSQYLNDDAVDDDHDNDNGDSSGVSRKAKTASLDDRLVETRRKLLQVEIPSMVPKLKGGAADSHRVETAVTTSSDSARESDLNLSNLSQQADKYRDILSYFETNRQAALEDLQAKIRSPLPPPASSSSSASVSVGAAGSQLKQSSAVKRDGERSSTSSARSESGDDSSVEDIIQHIAAPSRSFVSRREPCVAAAANVSE